MWKRKEERASSCYQISAISAFSARLLLEPASTVTVTITEAVARVSLAAAQRDPISQK